MPRLSAAVMGRGAGLATLVSLEAYWFLQPGPLPFKALAALLVTASIVRPAVGLMAFAGLAPLSTTVADLCGAYGMGAQLFEQIALGLGAGLLAHGGRSDDRTRIGGPALLVSAVAIASAASMIPAAAAPFA